MQDPDVKSMVSSSNPQNLTAWILEQVHHRPTHPALIFLQEGEVEKSCLTYAELDAQARTVAAHLQEKGLQGERILLMLSSSAEYVVCFLGCLYAGSIAVPAFPPSSSMHARRLEKIMEDCDARALIFHDQDEHLFQQLNPEDQGELRRPAVEILTARALCTPLEQPWMDPGLSPDLTAFLQYTSGSTQHPRGVMVTHQNLLDQARLFAGSATLNQEDVFVSWLPLFHDMGLIGTVLFPLYLGATIVLFPPTSFIQKPVRWLDLISRYRGTVSFAPNFAYALCASRVTAEHKKNLDLSCWTLAVNAAEPVHERTQEKFVQAFADCGFQSGALSPGYGLAEATLFVSVNARGAGAPLTELAHEGGASEPPRALVGCGPILPELTVKIVDPETFQVLPEGREGEIWIEGSVVAAGYWQRPEQTQQTFQAQLATGEGPFMRTGDLGILQQGQLYISGRLKDVLIFRGINHHAHDLETTVQEAHPALEWGRGAAFSVAMEDEEKLVVVQEVRRTSRKTFDGQEVVQAIRAALAEQHSLDIHAIWLLKPAAVHLTSSGKIQRHACKQDFLSHTFEPLFVWETTNNMQTSEQLKTATSDLDRAQRPSTEQVMQWLTQWISARCSIPQTEISQVQNFKRLGLDSVALITLAGELSTWMNHTVTPAELFNHTTIEQLSGFLTGQAGSVQGTKTSAHIHNQETPSPEKQKAQYQEREAIAIIGMACRFPGAPSTEAFWDLLQRGEDAITQVPASRWDVNGLFQQGEITPGKMNTSWGGFIDGVDEFDASFFGISPREARTMDPQQRLLLQTTWHALEDAGIPAERLSGSNTGVFVGVSSHDYQDLMRAHGVGRDAHAGTGNSSSLTANRISYTFNLLGPSWAVDTACSSSLVAVHQARQNLLSGQCDLAIVGGVNLILSPETTIIFSQAGMMSPEGRCKTFDACADGYVRSEGCGVILLKRYPDAVRDQDQILGLIAGSAVNQDGKSNGLTAPSGLAQQELMWQALDAAGKGAEEISYVEAHGTGTKLGDPIEVSSIRAVYGDRKADGSPLWVGSVKANIGHLEAAAGMAGLIKVVLSMQHRQLPANIHLKELSPYFKLEGSRCDFPRVLQDWAAGAGPRVAGVSAFSFGGTNAHVIVQEAPVSQVQDEDGYHLLPISAKQPSSLTTLVKSYRDLLERPGADRDFERLCHASALQRDHHRHRLAVVARSAQEAAQLLNRHLMGQMGPMLTAGEGTPNLKVCLMFTGQGSQHAGMGRKLYRRSRLFRDTIDRCDALLERLEGWSLKSLLLEGKFDLNQTRYAQPALFALEYGLARLWLSMGVQPAMMIGHSLGEYVAACIAGVFSLEDGLRLVACRGRLMQELTPEGSMVALHAPAQMVSNILERAGDRNMKKLAIAAHNSPNDLVLSGDPEKLEKMAAHFVENGATLKPLAVNRAFHSPLMEPMLEAFEQCARTVEYHLPQIPVVSNVTGQVAAADMATPGYWVKHVLARVEFAAGTEQIRASGCNVLIEVGPQPVLTGLACPTLPDAVWIPSLKRGQEEEQMFRQGLAQFYAAGGQVNWSEWTRDHLPVEAAPVRISLPRYPFEQERHWFDPAEKTHDLQPDQQVLSQPAVVQQVLPADEPVAGRHFQVPGSSNHHFERKLASGMPWWADQHRMLGQPVFPAAAFMAWAFGAVTETSGQVPSRWTLNELKFTRMLKLETDPLSAQMVLEPQPDGYRITCHSQLQGHWREHVTLHSRPAPATTGQVLHVQQTRDRLHLQPTAELYQGLGEMHMAYGPAFQGLLQLWKKDQEALARIRLPEGLNLERHVLHPVLLDTCLHPLFCFLSAKERSAACLPTAIREVQVHQALPAEVWSHVQWQGQTSENTFLADVHVHDENGNSLISLLGIELTRLGSPVSKTPVEEAAVNPLQALETVWEPLQVEVEKTPPSTGHWLIFSPQAEEAEFWKGALQDQGFAALSVSCGPRFDWNPACTIRVAIRSEDSFAQLFRQLEQENAQIEGLVLLGGIGAVSDRTVDDAVLSLTCPAVLMLQHFLASHADRRPEVLICTRGAQQIPGFTDLSDETSLTQSALHGLARAVTAEFPHLRCVEVDLDPDQKEQCILHLFAAVHQLGGSGQLAWRQGQVFQAKLQKAALKEVRPAFRVNPEGTYLITGGLGGLGQVFARELLEQGAKHLVLVGRSAGELSSDLQNLIQQDIQIRTFQADVSSRSEMEHLLRHIEGQMPPLQGVIHAAGVLDDGLFSDLNWSRFTSVLDPKVRGAWNLHELTRHLTLDFFVMFSSISSLIGTAGQANYIVGNAFMDALAHHRHHLGLPGLSINWGPWNTVGMSAQKALEERFVQKGIQSIPPEQGVQAFVSALALNRPQIGLAQIDGKKLTASRDVPDLLLSELQQSSVAESSVAVGLPEVRAALDIRQLSPEMARRQILEVLFEFTAQSLHLKQNQKARLQGHFAQQALNALGLDSLMAIELRNKIMVHLGAEIPVQHWLGGTTPAEIADLVYEQLLVRQLALNREVAADETEVEEWTL